MKRKIWTAFFLAGVMAIQPSVCTVYGADFTDGQEIAGEVEFTDKPESINREESDLAKDMFSSGDEIPPVDEEVQDYAVIDGVDYVYQPETDSYMVRYIVSAEKETITLQKEISGKKVTEIGSEIFGLYDDDEPDTEYQVAEVVIPDTVVKIQEYAFLNGNMITVHMPDSVTEIGTKAFQNCEHLRYLYFSGGISVFPQQLFGNCIGLDTIEVGEGVVQIESGAMKNCPSLQKVYIPPSVNQIGEDLFDEGVHVTIYGEAGSYAEQYAISHKIPFFVEKEKDPEPEQSQVDYEGVRYIYQKASKSYCAANYLGNLENEVAIPEFVNGAPVSEIGENAFSSCYKLEKITIPQSVKKIGSRAFASCGRLKEVVMEQGIKELGDEVFSCCENLENVSLPDSITIMGEKTFGECISLKNVKLSSGLTEIPAETFYLAQLDGNLVIPKGVKSIGTGAFRYARFDGIQLPDTLVSIGKEGFACVQVDNLTIPNSVTHLGTGAFMELKAKTITLGWGIKVIPKSAFENCNGLEAVVLPGSVSKIMDKAFWNTEIRRLYVPASVKYIVKNAFLNNLYLTLYVPKNSFGEKYAKAMKVPFDNGSIYNAVVVKDGIKYEYHSNSQTYEVVKGDQELAGEVVIPEKINGKKVTSIEQYGFSRCASITSVQLPDTIREIGEGAFMSCGLKKINIPNGVKTIRESTFHSSKLEEIVIPSSVTTIEDSAFGSCELKKIIIPDTVTDFGKYVFKSCKYLEEAKLPETMAEIPESTFQYCESLKSISLPSGLEKIGLYAFEDTGLVSVKFPSKLKIIGGAAFAGCTNLGLDHIPDTVTSLGSAAFRGCQGIEEVTVTGSIELLYGDTFGACKNLKKVWIKEGVERIYGATSIFAGCDKLEEIHIPDSVRKIEGTLSANENCTVYSTTGSKVEAYCLENDIPFQSVGNSVLETPKVKVVVKNGNEIFLTQEKWSKNAEFFDYVFTQDSNFPQTGRYINRKDGLVHMDYTFVAPKRGNYWLFFRAGRKTGENKEETEYTQWSSVKVRIIGTIKPSKVEKIAVQGSSVKVKVSSSPGAAGYGIVLAEGITQEKQSLILMPQNIQYSSRNNKSVIYTFKNVKPGSYHILSRAYKKVESGTKTLYSVWSAYEYEVLVKK